MNYKRNMTFSRSSKTPSKPVIKSPLDKQIIMNIRQMKYPAPYSQSWAGIGHSKRSFIADKNSNKTISAVQSITNKYSNRGPTTQRKLDPTQRFTGLDPTVPHLKYGVFPKKLYITRDQSRILNVKPSGRIATQADHARREQVNFPKKTHCVVEARCQKIDRPAIKKVSTVQKFLQNTQKVQGETSDGPVFVFRPLEHRNLHSLTLSASTHLDIKPKPLHNSILPPQLYKLYK